MDRLSIRFLSAPKDLLKHRDRMIIGAALVAGITSSFLATSLAVGQETLARADLPAASPPDKPTASDPPRKRSRSALQLRRDAVPPPSPSLPAVTAPSPPAVTAPPSPPVAATPSTVAADAPAIGALVTSADRLSIKFQGHPTLSGEYRIGGDETLTIPAVGRIKVTGQTFSTLETLLNAEVLRLTGRGTFATVEVLDYREVFVTGFVGKAGSFPWKRGMTVLHAETMSGGVFRPTGQNGSPLPADAEKTRARHAAADLSRLLAQQARLNAEQSGAKTLVATAAMRKLASEAEIEPIMAAERAVLLSRLSTFEAQSAALVRLKNSAQAELATLKGQTDRIDAQLKKRRELQRKIDVLMASGVVTNEKVLTEQARVLELEERAANVTYAHLRAESTALGAERDLEVLRLQRDATIETERQRLNRDVAQLEIEVDSASSSFQKMTGRPALAFSSQLAQPLLSYEIIRNDANRPRTVQADASTALMPGDIVVVSVHEGS